MAQPVPHADGYVPFQCELRETGDDLEKVIAGLKWLRGSYSPDSELVRHADAAIEHCQALVNELWPMVPLAPQIGG